MKLVKFNVESGFKNIPDDKYHAECARLNDLADNGNSTLYGKIIREMPLNYIT